MTDFEQRIEAIEKQLLGTNDLLKALINAYNAQEEQTLEGFKMLAAALKSISAKLEDYIQHNS